MNRETLLIALKNLGWLALVMLPMFFVLTWVQALIAGAEGSRDLGYVVEAGGFYYLTYVLWVLLGGLVHQILVFLLPGSWGRAQRRVVAILLTPVIPVLVILVGEQPATVTGFLIPLILALAIYGLLIHLPGDRPEPATA